MDMNKLEKKFVEVLNNLDSVVISNKIRAELLREEVESMLSVKPHSNKTLNQRSKNVTSRAR